MNNVLNSLRSMVAQGYIKPSKDQQLALAIADQRDELIEALEKMMACCANQENIKAHCRAVIAKAKGE
jgi:mannitol/fructose-specific phosphotransferase system IIA component